MDNITPDELLEQECPVCLSKTVTTESLPAIAALIRATTENLLSLPESKLTVEATEQAKTKVENYEAMVNAIKRTIQALKDCDCGAPESEDIVEDEIIISDENLGKIYDT